MKTAPEPVRARNCFGIQNVYSNNTLLLPPSITSKWKAKPIRQPRRGRKAKPNSGSQKKVYLLFACAPRVAWLTWTQDEMELLKKKNARSNFSRSPADLVVGEGAGAVVVVALHHLEKHGERTLL